MFVLSVGTLDLDAMVWETLPNCTTGFLGLGALFVDEGFTGAVCPGRDVGAGGAHTVGALEVGVAGVDGVSSCGVGSLVCCRWTQFLLYNPPSSVATS